MLSARCKAVVKEELKKLGLHFIFVELGEVEVMEDLSTEQREQLKIALEVSGFELMDDKKAILIERIKTIIIEMVHNGKKSAGFRQYPTAGGWDSPYGESVGKYMYPGLRGVRGGI